MKRILNFTLTARLLFQQQNATNARQMSVHMSAARLRLRSKSGHFDANRDANQTGDEAVYSLRSSGDSIAMNVKGTAFFARKLLLEAQFGEADAKKMLEVAVAAVPDFPQLVLVSTLIPMAPFLKLQDEILNRYFAGDPHSFLEFGEMSADWALTKGPYKGLAADKDIDAFAASGAAIYRTYFDTGTASTALREGHVEFRIEGIPKEFRHVYVEYGTVGYFKRGMEILGATNVEARRLRGYSVGSDHVHYEVHFRRGPSSGRTRIPKPPTLT